MGDSLRNLIERIVRAFVDWVQRCLPPYDPSAWNDANGVQYNNNCYNYACDMKTGTYAQPGRGTGHEYTAIDCQHVDMGAVSDGLVPVDCDAGCGCSECQHQVALVIKPGGVEFGDFHWWVEAPPPILITAATSSRIPEPPIAGAIRSSVGAIASARVP